MTISDPYEFMRRACEEGVICAAIPAVDDDGRPIVWMTSSKYLGGSDPMRAFVAALAITRRAYREARKNGIDTLV
jgi:hypothetical protein